MPNNNYHTPDAKAARAPKDKLRNFSFLDRVLTECEHLLKTVSATEKSPRASPANNLSESQPDNDAKLSNQEKTKAIQFMRINHCGEVCAQALYQSQSWFARNPATLSMLKKSGQEEQDHLAWCAKRVHELGGHTSLLDPLFYTSSLALGALAGFYGDNISMGFIEETEHQVWRHLQSHISDLSNNDIKTLAIIKQMQKEEAEHAAHAHSHGAKSLPWWVRAAMRCTAKVMTHTTRWI
jgi:ubiquinone biosynthesis monooxygenase Coq7